MQQNRKRRAEKTAGGTAIQRNFNFLFVFFFKFLWPVPEVYTFKTCGDFFVFFLIQQLIAFNFSLQNGTSSVAFSCISATTTTTGRWTSSWFRRTDCKPRTRTATQTRSRGSSCCLAECKKASLLLPCQFPGFQIELRKNKFEVSP